MTATEEASQRLVIKWRSKLDAAKKEAIRHRFGIPAYETLNGLSPVELKAEDRGAFEETARRGFFSILPMKWCKNGGLYVFKSCK